MSGRANQEIYKKYNFLLIWTHNGFRITKGMQTLLLVTHYEHCAKDRIQ